MATTAQSIDTVVFTIGGLDVSPDVVKGAVTPKANSGSTIVTADGGKVLIPGDPTTWSLDLTVLVNDDAASFLRAKCFDAAGTTVAFTAAIKNAGTTTSTITGTVILQPGAIRMGDPWGKTETTDISLDATVTSWA